MIKHGTIVKRNNNYFKVKKDIHGNYYLACMLGNAVINGYKRIAKSKIEKDYEIVNNYDDIVKQGFIGL